MTLKFNACMVNDKMIVTYNDLSLKIKIDIGPKYFCQK
jgi:hypothetical protein